MRRTDTAGGAAFAVPAAVAPTVTREREFPDCTSAVDCGADTGKHNETCPRTALTDGEIGAFVGPDADELVRRQQFLGGWNGGWPELCE